MFHYLQRIYEILTKARDLADSNKWEDLEEYADSKLDEMISLVKKVVSLKFKLNQSDDVFEENRWEFFSTMTGSHSIDLEFGNYRLRMSLNMENGIGKPILSFEETK
jgi:hypothetical protein